MQTSKTHPRLSELQYLRATLGHLCLLRSSLGDSDATIQGTSILVPIALAHMNLSHT